MPESGELLGRRRPAGGTLPRLLSTEHRAATWRLWVGTFFAFTTLYTLISWVPSLARAAGVRLEGAIQAGTVLNLGALVGTCAIGIVARWIGLRRFALSALLLAIVSLLLLAGSNIGGAFGLPLVFLIGATVQGGFNSYYPIATRVYPPELRASGVGFAMGIGRAGAVLGPLAAGYLLAAGVPMARLFVGFSMPLLVSALAVHGIRRASLEARKPAGF